MKKYKGIVIILCFSFFISCSKNDAGADEKVIVQPISFIAIGENEERVFQFVFDSKAENQEQTDLTAELGVNTTYLTLREDGNVLSFYSFASGKFSLAQKNVQTGATTLIADFYTETNERSILWGSNDEKSIFLGFFEGVGSSNFRVLTVEIASGTSVELIIEDNIKTSYQPIYHQGKLLLTYLDASNNYNISVIDVATNSIQKKLEFGKRIPNVLLNDFGDIVILKSEQGENYSYVIYDSVTLESNTEVDFALRRYFDPGVLSARLIENKLLYYSLYVQPASIKFGPAFFDFETNTETLLDIERLVFDFEVEKGQSIQLISQGYNEANEAFLVGYANLNDNAVIDGGVLIISYEGKLIENVALPFAPTYFLTDN